MNNEILRQITDLLYCDWVGIQSCRNRENIEKCNKLVELCLSMPNEATLDKIYDAFMEIARSPESIQYVRTALNIPKVESSKVLSMIDRCLGARASAWMSEWLNSIHKNNEIPLHVELLKNFVNAKSVMSCCCFGNIELILVRHDPTGSLAINSTGSCAYTLRLDMMKFRDHWNQETTTFHQSQSVEWMMFIRAVYYAFLVIGMILDHQKKIESKVTDRNLLMKKTRPKRRTKHATKFIRRKGIQGQRPTWH